ncbi:MAG: acyl-CoA/acyl-ACP dehydrogenase [Gammaproteobacteria bacterium]|jgi:alkylation response protein AidB-like acyl-CoA dehydrogenase|nr:acyl-CoA/acyl-ACP dehydrogenase [Gammaproteobacteria bacterium]MBT4492515.1 acyl-CoA/acyl-ACP dehydrogenase [Gammaproteobacteria bacterium]
MQTGFTEDQEAFREVVARFLQDKSQPTTVRKLMETDQGYDPDVWQQLCNEVGLAGTHLPEEYGGFGFGPVELGIAAEEMGRYLYCGPFFASSVMAGYALLLAGSEEAKTRMLPEIAAGSLIATLVLDNLNSLDLVGQKVLVNNGRLNGAADLVVDAQNASQLLVIASSGDELGLFSVATDSAGIGILPVEALDPTRKLARVTFDDVEVERVGDVSSEILDQIWDYLNVALAHEMVGGAQRLLDTTIEYTKIRYQFGRPIGSFQGLKHRCADLLMELEFARAATHYAAFCLAAGDGEPYVSSMAKAMASETYMNAAKEAVQMRGGIGFTWEEDTHLWYKRAKSSEVFLGTPAVHRERMMTMMGEVA